MESEIEKILLSANQIEERVTALADDIRRAYADRELVIVSLLSGTVLFLADLIRRIPLPLKLDFMGVSSYGDGTSPGELVFTKELRLDVRDRDVLIVDDILDTGRTLDAVRSHLKHLSPRTLRSCVLLSKPARREIDVDADYVGFEIPDAFVVGYGMDFAERFRNLPYIGVLKPSAVTS